MRGVRGVAGILAVLGLLAQVWTHVDWIDGLSEHCDYPEECVVSWLPRAFFVAEALWVLTVLSGVVALVSAAWLRELRASMFLDVFAWTTSFVAYLLTPRWRTDEYGHLPPGDPFFDGTYRTGVGLMLLAAIVHIGSLVLRKMATDRTSTTDPADGSREPVAQPRA